MRSLATVAVIEAAAVAAAAGPYKWSQERYIREWRPAGETPSFGYMPLLGTPSPPAPTTPPVIDPRRLEARANGATCAYISGKADSSLYCGENSACVYNTGNSHIGCCPSADVKCPLFTTCLDSSQSSLATSLNGFTLLCTDSAYPYCLKHIFGDATYFGYTLLGCGKTSGSSDLVLFSATESATTSSTTSSSTTSSSTSSSSSTTRSQTTTTLPPQTPTGSPDSSSSPPVGPIVGGAVGGVAALGLIGIGAAVLIRRSRNSTPSSPSSGPPKPPAPAASPPGQSILGPNAPHEMAQQQHHYPQGYAPVPSADAAAKPHDPYNPSPGHQSYYDPDPQQQQRVSVQAISPLSSPPIQQGQVQYAVPAQQQHQQPYPVGQAPQYAQPYQVAQPQGQPYQVAQPQPGLGYHGGPVAATYEAVELDAPREPQPRELPS